MLGEWGGEGGGGGEGKGISHIFLENFIEILKSFGRYEDFLLQH